MITPTATYRLQLHAGFGFADAAAQLPYLQALGVSHLYLSPILQAAAGSTHGYDVVDHDRISEDLGGAAGFADLAQAAQALGLGIVLDIVPNHMSVPTPAHGNRPLWELLRDGPDSRYAAWFDVDWAAGDDTILMPILGRTLAEALQAGELTLAGDGGSEGTEAVVRYFEHEFPVRPGTQELPLAQLLDRQWWRLAPWQAADLNLNYRRFFDIKTLVAVRVEDPEVFAETHSTIAQLVRSGAVQGLRVDHPDGLADPRGYLRMLAVATDDAWVVVEKILETDERLPADWPVAGTTGYDALKRAGGVFLDPAGAEPLLATLAVLTGDARGPDEFALEAKMQVGLRVQAAEIQRLVRLLVAVCDGLGTSLGEDVEVRPEMLRRALSAVLVGMSRYRAYVHPEEPASDEAVRVLTDAAARGAELVAASDLVAVELVRDLALGRYAALGTHESEAARREFVLRFQQTCGPVQAKGIEDTAFYRWLHLTALNEVGGNPGEFGCSPDEFAEFSSYLQATWPATMTTLSTHDTKRSEDARAALAPISELALDWSVWMHQAGELASPARPERLDPTTEYLIWQSLVATWPTTPARLTAYALKAAREACRHTSWVERDEAYEQALSEFIDWALASPAVAGHVLAWLARTQPHVRAVTLGQKLIQLTMPGVPDVYQGCELVSRTLVDPDNRRPVDFTERARRLAALDAGAPPSDRDDEKLLVTSRALRVRREHPDWFGPSATVAPVAASSEHLLAFSRGTEQGPQVVVLATRLVERLTQAGGWGAASVELPDGRWRDAFTGALVAAGREGTPIGQILATLPVALLVRQD